MENKKCSMSNCNRDAQYAGNNDWSKGKFYCSQHAVTPKNSPDTKSNFDLPFFSSESFPFEQRNTTSLPIRSFSTGATRDTDSGKLAYEGFFSPAVLRRRAQYMHKHRKMADGSMREPDNWQKGIPMNVYLDSLIRHTVELWLAKRGEIEMDTDAMEEYMQDTLCAIMFNAEGLIMERMKLQKGHAEKENDVR